MEEVPSVKVLTQWLLGVWRFTLKSQDAGIPRPSVAALWCNTSWTGLLVWGGGRFHCGCLCLGSTDGQGGCLVFQDCLSLRFKPTICLCVFVSLFVSLSVFLCV